MFNIEPKPLVVGTKALIPQLLVDNQPDYCTTLVPAFQLYLIGTLAAEGLFTSLVMMRVWAKRELSIRVSFLGSGLFLKVYYFFKNKFT